MYTEKIIYDIGGNSGQNLPYYLSIASRVIFVEANPTLCESVRRDFSSFVNSGRLVVENVVANTDEKRSGSYVDFYISNFESVWSQYTPPPNLQDFTRISVETKDLTHLINDYGPPYYVKIDVEHYDHVLLKYMLTRNIRPPYISAEIHHAETLAHLISFGEYRAFKLVNGATVSTRYKDAIVQTVDGSRLWSFPNGSAGPFGNDIHGRWMTAKAITKVIGLVGFGWKDVHASLVDDPDLSYEPGIRVLLDADY